MNKVLEESCPTYAVLFKTHTWDGFVERQLDRLRHVTRDENIFVVFDTTNRKYFPNTVLKTLEINEYMSSKSGFFNFPVSNSFWYNNDYPLYLFLDRFPQYEYVAVCEYDCNVSVDVEKMVRSMHSNGVDFVGEIVRSDPDHWHWLPSVVPHYPGDLTIRGRLLCFSIFSARFCDVLRKKRLLFSKTIPQTLSGSGAAMVPLWPFGEAFIGAELAIHGLKSDMLSTYGLVEHYDWAPPYHERQLSSLMSGFSHPILDNKRFINSIFHKLHWKSRDLFAAGSEMRNWFYHIPTDIVVILMAEVFSAQKDVKSLYDLEMYAHARGLRDHEALIEYYRNQMTTVSHTENS